MPILLLMAIRLKIVSTAYTGDRRQDPQCTKIRYSLSLSLSQFKRTELNVPNQCELTLNLNGKWTKLFGCVVTKPSWNCLCSGLWKSVGNAFVFGGICTSCTRSKWNGNVMVASGIDIFWRESLYYTCLYIHLYKGVWITFVNCKCIDVKQSNSNKRERRAITTHTPNRMKPNRRKGSRNRSWKKSNWILLPSRIAIVQSTHTDREIGDDDDAWRTNKDTPIIFVYKWLVIRLFDCMTRTIERKWLYRKQISRVSVCSGTHFSPSLTPRQMWLQCTCSLSHSCVRRLSTYLISPNHQFSKTETTNSPKQKAYQTKNATSIKYIR